MLKSNKKLFIIIDANAVFHRAYHALPRFTTKAGELVNAVYGFGAILLQWNTSAATNVLPVSHFYHLLSVACSL